MSNEKGHAHPEVGVSRGKGLSMDAVARKALAIPKDALSRKDPLSRKHSVGKAGPGRDRAVAAGSHAETLEARSETRGAFTVFAPPDARREELKRQNKGDEAAINKLRQQRAAAGPQYTVPKGGVVLGGPPPATTSAGGGKSTTGPKVRIESQSRSTPRVSANCGAPGPGRRGADAGGKTGVGPRARIQRSETAEERREKFAAALEKKFAAAQGLAAQGAAC